MPEHKPTTTTQPPRPDLTSPKLSHPSVNIEEAFGEDLTVGAEGLEPPTGSL